MRPIAPTRLAPVALVACLVAGAADATADTNCTFTISDSVMALDADCTTDRTIVIPDGLTLDGRGHTITAMDPPGGGHFLGAVVRNGGATASVMDLTITALNLADVCDRGFPADTRLRGILFDGASGTIAHNAILGVNQGVSACHEGNAIEVRNAPTDGTHPNTQHVTIADNRVEGYQKTGIVATGDVDVIIENNEVGGSATQTYLAANGIQVGFGARGTVRNNDVVGNQWCGLDRVAATGILLLASAPGTDVSQNSVRGNSDLGIFVLANGATFVNNRVVDEGPDCNQSGWDIGIGNYGADSLFMNNKVRGFELPYDGVTAGDNRTIPAANN